MADDAWYCLLVAKKIEDLRNRQHSDMRHSKSEQYARHNGGNWKGGGGGGGFKSFNDKMNGGGNGKYNGYKG